MKRSPQPDAVTKIDIRSVAARAKVSIATVSRAMNYIPTVDPKLAGRVWKAVEELNYTPNSQARALVSGRSQLLGLIISELTNPFFPELVQEFERFAVEHGYEILIGSTNYDPQKMRSCVRRMIERKVAGIAVMTFAMEEQFLAEMAGQAMPVVSTDVLSEGKHGSVIAVDYRAGIHEAVQHLAVLGHRRIAFISGPLRLRSARARHTAFLESLSGSGISVPQEFLIEGDHTLDGGRDAMKKVLALREWPTAIMCSNDMTAIGVQHAVYEANLRIPKDFSLVGFDNIHLASYTIPPLTTVQMSPAELARSAVLTLLEKLPASKPGTAEKGSAISTRLIVRQTTGLPRGALDDLELQRPVIV